MEPTTAFTANLSGHRPVQSPMATASLRHALRRLWRDRSTTLVALATLALGTGASTSLFTVVNAVLVKPLPYPAADRLVVIRLRDAEFRGRYPSFPVNAAHIAIWRDHCTACEDITAIGSMVTTITGAGEAEQLDAARVTANFFTFLGITPVVGRGFAAEEDHPGANGVAVISHALWIRRFGGDRGIVGRSIELDGAKTIVVGILPEHAPIPGPQQLGDLVRLAAAIDVYRPAAFTPDQLRSGGDLDYGVVARLRPGMNADAVRTQLDALEPTISRQTSDDGRKRSFVQPLHDVVVRNARMPLLVLLTATVAVLLIVCVNLANLLLAREAGRRRETALQTALGASRRRIVVDALTESVVLAAGGGLLGVAVAWTLTQVIVTTAPPALPLLNAFAFDARVLLFGVASTLAAGVFIGALPAARMAAIDPGDALKDGSYTATGGPHGIRGRRVLVAAQSAIGVALLVTTGLLLVSFVRLLQVDKGFATTGILTADIALPASSYTRADRQLRFYDEVMTRARGLPGVTDVALTSTLPLRGESVVNFLSYVVDRRPASERPLANYRYVTPGYFATIGTPLLRGRTFQESDRARQVIVLSASAAHALWPGQDPIGRQVKTGGFLGAVSDVIGVAADSRAVDLSRTDVLFAYLPYWMRGPSAEAEAIWTPLRSGASLVLRMNVPPASLGRAIRQAIWSVDPGVAIPRVETMDDVIALSVADRRFELSLMVAFGCIAALLAGLGVYGVVSYSVARRGREIRIRVALGARPRDIRRLVMREGVVPAACGLLGGLTASWGIGRAMSSLLFNVQPGDPGVMLAAAGTLIVTTVFACAGPARRASATTDIAATLR
jgi:predicted permease